MALTPMQEAFAQAVASGKSKSEAYRIAYPRSKQWKPESVWNKASAIASHVGVSARIDEIRAELSDRGIWTRENSARALIGVVNSPDKASDIVAAVKELNAMHGFEAPKEIKHSGSTPITLVVQGVKPDA